MQSDGLKSALSPVVYEEFRGVQKINDVQKIHTKKCRAPISSRGVSKNSVFLWKPKSD